MKRHRGGDADVGTTADLQSYYVLDGSCYVSITLVKIVQIYDILLLIQFNFQFSSKILLWLLE